MNSEDTRCDPLTIKEVWAIEHDGRLVPPGMDDDGTSSFLAFPTREEAEQGINYQYGQGYFDESDGLKVRKVG